MAMVQGGFPGDVANRQNESKKCVPARKSFSQTNVRIRGRWALSARSFKGTPVIEITLSVKLTVAQIIRLCKAVVIIIALLV